MSLTRGGVPGLLVVLAGCGMDPGSFRTDFADRYCALTLECVDEAELGFDGIVDQEDCLAQVGPTVEEWGADCDFERRSARRCLKALDALGCPSADDEHLDEVLPGDCDQVFVCEGAPASFPTTYSD